MGNSPAFSLCIDGGKLFCYLFCLLFLCAICGSAGNNLLWMQCPQFWVNRSNLWTISGKLKVKLFLVISFMIYAILCSVYLSHENGFLLMFCTYMSIIQWGLLFPLNDYLLVMCVLLVNLIPCQYPHLP